MSSNQNHATSQVTSNLKQFTVQSTVCTLSYVTIFPIFCCTSLRINASVLSTHHHQITTRYYRARGSCLPLV
jgi:hypothetical protein